VKDPSLAPRFAPAHRQDLDRRGRSRVLTGRSLRVLHPGHGLWQSARIPNPPSTRPLVLSGARQLYGETAAAADFAVEVDAAAVRLDDVAHDR